MDTFVIAFESTHAAMAASKALSGAGEPYLTIPVPRGISAGCGIALKFDADEPSRMIGILFPRGATGLAKLYRQTGHDAFEFVMAL